MWAYGIYAEEEEEDAEEEEDDDDDGCGKMNSVCVGKDVLGVVVGLDEVAVREAAEEKAGCDA